MTLLNRLAIAPSYSSVVATIDRLGISFSFMMRLSIIKLSIGPSTSALFGEIKDRKVAVADNLILTYRHAKAHLALILSNFFFSYLIY
jgi:hypothetical protein